MSRENVPNMLLIADKYRLLRLKKAAVQFIMRNDMNYAAMHNSDVSEAFSAELLHILWTYGQVRKPNSVSEAPSSLTVQWGDVPHEFPDTTVWNNLSKSELRRACFERLLGTSATASELVVLLSGTDPTADDSPATKRQRTDST
eukprot:TRINITY_DN17365_c0_g1_i1.p1 TRINITY_DN17365_c0_g1~~TRINITY_DN17365_c0_g1_i1.p1  ORF type:complete len:165 (+),score=23.47 TRINITY_DN17365_c0_g1_i1:64-495(+)